VMRIAKKTDARCEAVHRIGFASDTVCVIKRGVVVDGNAEVAQRRIPGLPVVGERNRTLLELGAASLEHLQCVFAGHPTDVHTGDGYLWIDAIAVETPQRTQAHCENRQDNSEHEREPVTATAKPIPPAA